ncbi:MAG: ribonuclease H-like domain-containing protein [Nitrospirota bacterium]|nr:ribonuclease H-like domain-containing protein [Nitrospirota bacterium]
MLESTFIFLNGIGESTERRLWDQGIVDWYSFLDCSLLPGIAPARKHLYDREVAAAIDHYQSGNWRFFARCLKSREHWRLFQTLRSRTVFLDIETTGEPAGMGEVTVVGLYANGTLTTLVQGETLTEERLCEEFSRYSLLVTFFGSGFDLPYLLATFPRLNLEQAHFDLCFAARRLGLRGGLKHIELEVGLSRPSEIQGFSGWDAVHLWQAWKSGNAEAKRLLCVYNEADVRNLEPLAEYLFGQLISRYGSVQIQAIN